MCASTWFFFMVSRKTTSGKPLQAFLQVSGPFAMWEHTHRFESTGEFTNRLTDSIRLPMGMVGGRVRTDSVDGFLLDRGFQVYLDAYPDTGAPFLR